MKRKEGWMAQARRLGERWATNPQVRGLFSPKTITEALFAGYVVGYRAARRSKP